MIAFERFVLDYQAHQFDKSVIVHADCFEWLGRIPETWAKLLVKTNDGY